MSSEYRPICVSHQPCIVTGDDSTYAEAPVLELIRTQAGRHTLGHPNCRLVVGRWSGSLVEVTCPGGPDSHAPGFITHRDPVTVEAAWLRLAAMAPDLAASARLPSCWSAELIEALVPELNLPGFGE